MRKQLKSEIAKCISKSTELVESEILSQLEMPKNKDHGDLAFPCFQLAQAWKCKPNETSLRLAKELKLPSGVASATPAGPFLNFSFERTAICDYVVTRVLAKNFEINKELKKQNVIVEYSSPNIAKPFHVGHLRATLIGNCLDRVYRFLGYNVTSINHLGDWGTQFGFVWAGCEIFGKPKNPTVSSLVELYRKSTRLKELQEKKTLAPEDEDKPDVNLIARNYFKDLEAGKDYAVEFWQWCLDISLEYFRTTYSRLGINFDHYTGESFYSEMLEDVRKEIEKKKILVESEGALGVDLGEQLGFARIYTPDGRSLYLTRDIATALYRAKTFKFDKAVYVVGAPQNLHFQQLKGVLTKLGYDFSEKMIHAGFGHVLGMKTRSEGDFIELNDFVDEATDRALKAYQDQVSKRPEGLNETEVAEAVGISAVTFGTLSKGRLKDVHFDWNNALEFQGDSGPYLLYAYARINGIKEKACENKIEIPTKIDFSKLTDSEAYGLIRLIDQFEDYLVLTVRDNEPNHLCNYTLELAKTFSKAYNHLKVIGEEKNLASARLALFETTHIVLGKCIELLGIRVIERM
jgi:arginyl-tRNA synthetase